ncbi:MAG: reverse transcriptase-like protein [Pseudomonadota bacterium]
MTDHANLLALSFNAERAAARRLAGATGVSPEQALRQILTGSAGNAGLDVLLAGRAAAQAADLARKAARAAQRASAEQTRQARHAGEPSAWRGWFDGSAHPNPGRCGIGALLIGPAGEQVEIAQSAGFGNSSEAEYLALIALLRAAVAAGAHPLTIYGDSQVVIGDVHAPNGAGAASLAPHRAAALALIAQLPALSLRWVPRHRNCAADALSQRGAAMP